MDRDRSRGVALALGVLFLLGGVGPGAAAPRLVATIRLQTGPVDVTIPEKVAVLLAGERRDLAFEVPGRLEFWFVVGIASIQPLWHFAMLPWLPSPPAV